MILEIINENKYYSLFIDIITKLDIKDILLISVDYNTIMLFIEDDLEHDKILKISDYFKLIYSTRCGLMI